MILKKNRVERTLFRKIGNSIIGFFVAIFFIIALIFAFSQTSTFRNALRDKIVELANNSLNGKLNIDQVDGTLITHLVLRNVTLEKDLDTFFVAKKIEFAINPFYILAKRIKVTRVSLSDVNLAILETSHDKWNISNIAKVDTTSELAVADSSTGESGNFPFTIEISDFALKNISFKLKKNEYLTLHREYTTINYDDIEIENLDIRMSLLANLNKMEIFADISRLTFTSNLSMFGLQNLSGQVHLTPGYTEVKNLEVITDSSNITFSARLDDFNVFENIDTKDFEKYPITLDIVAHPFNMCDLNSFIEPTNFMHGAPDFTFNGKGKYGNFDFESTLKLKTTSINMKGNIANLHNPLHLYTKADFYNSDILYSELDSFLNGLELPKYPNLFVEDINITYEGKPLKFNAYGTATIGDGNFSINTFMDMTKELTDYDYQLTTNNLNLKTLLGIESRLNTKGNLKGSGFDPEKSTSQMAFIITNSHIAGHKIDTANIELHTIDKLIDLSIFSRLDSMQNEISGKLDLATADKPIYNLRGNFKNLNLLNFTQDTTLNSSLNFTFEANGQSLDLDKTEGDFELSFNNSQIGSNHFDSINFKIDLSKLDDTRLISFKSDILDFNITGDFSLNETLDLLGYQSQKLNYAIAQKLNEINPLIFSADTSNTLELLTSNKKYSQKDIYLDYDFNFKDFKLIAALLNRDKVEISGKGYGYLENDSDNFNVSTTVDLDWLFLFKGKEVFYVSDVESNFDIGADNHKYSFDNIFSTFSLTSEEMVSALNINNIKADIIFNQSQAFVNVTANVNDKLDTEIEGYFSFSDSTESIKISNLLFAYNNYTWQNRDSIYLSNSPTKFEINNFNLFNGESKLSIDGSIINKLNQNINLVLSNVDGGVLANKFLDSDDANSNINLTAQIRGTTVHPIYNLNFSMDDFKLKNNYIGSLFGKINYVNKNITTNIEFTNRINDNKKLLTLSGNIPINLDMKQTTENDHLQKLALNLKTYDFNLSAFGDAIPTVLNPSGIVNSDISVDGELDDFNLSGYFSAKYCRFTSEISNLDYIADLNLVFDEKNIQLQNSFIKNNGKTKFPGRINLTGKIDLNGYSIALADIFMDGNIALLSPNSKSSLPYFYGDLLIKSNKPWHYQIKDGKQSFTGNMILEEATLNFIPLESSYSVSNSDFRYVFIDSNLASELQKEKQSKLLSALLIKKTGETKDNATTDFNLDLKISSPNTSKLSVVLSKALNQKLLANFTGELKIRNHNNKLTSQGEFNILPSSMFIFYKTFSAEGSIKFSDDLINPIVNITSTYIADYTNPRNEDAEPIKTAVKIKIDGPAMSVLENMASGKKPLNMQVYTGAQNIDYDVPNQQYSGLDAMYFVLLGKFSSDIENAGIAKSAGYSMLGSAITSGLNAHLGNFISNVNFNQTGKQTRINVSGRVQEFRYTIGGAIERPDWSEANAKFEYLFNPQFIIRVERKDPVISSSSKSQKVHELGAMYRFTF